MKYFLRYKYLSVLVLCGLLVLLLAVPVIVQRSHIHLLTYYFNYSDPALAMAEGNYYFGGGGYDLNKAAHSYQLALKLSPNIFGGHYQLARVYFVQGDLTRATTEIDTELMVNPTNLRALYIRGLIEMSQNTPDGLSLAEVDFKRFILWAPTEWAGYNDLAFVLAKEGKYVESEAVITEAMQKVPGSKDIPWLWNSLGLAQLNELHYKDAEASFVKALALAKDVSPQEWHRAYSGNDPASVEVSIRNFQEAIKKNLSLAQVGQRNSI